MKEKNVYELVYKLFFFYFISYVKTATSSSQTRELCEILQKSFIIEHVNELTLNSLEFSEVHYSFTSKFTPQVNWFVKYAVRGDTHMMSTLRGEGD